MPLVLPSFSLKTIDDGRYRFLDLLGSGAYGVVYRAVERVPEDSSLVIRAIKIMPAVDPLSHPAVLQTRETKLHELVSNVENVVTLHRVIRTKDHVFIVMDYFEGGDLFNFIHKHSPFAGNTARLKRVFLQIIDGVAACHKRGVYHRDLKPENIMTNASLSRVCISDFGLATSRRSSTAFNTGSKRYMCPECVDCSDTDYPYDTPRADTWALGIILLHLAVLRVPWYKATLTDASFRQYITDPTHLRNTFPISPALDALLHRVFTIVPESALSLAEFRAAVEAVDTFWMSRAEIA
ncbi:kinase-like domain-containing protein, partial [Epithele typhae]|uniref:kinase-like domain-containing protein n=1 Tax=Epithele typhae TaxID=378194 RepID=UPI0020078FE9